MPATAYSYDPVTLAFVGTTTADDNPLEEGELLLPAFATLEEPPDPIPPGMRAHWVGDEWELRAQGPSLPPVEEPQTDATRTARLRALAQAVLDSVAREKGFQSMLEAVTYANEPAVKRFQREGRRLRRMRSLLWDEVDTILNEALGSGDWPTESEFLARLPTYGEMRIMEDQENGDED